MGLAIPHALGRNQKFFAKAESTYGTFAKPAATNALKVLKSSFDWKQLREDRMDSRASRSSLERITGRKEASWSIEGYVVPSGSLGTAPDWGEILKAGFGVETVNASTSVVYTCTASQTAQGSLSLVRHFNDIYMQALFGAFVESLSLKLEGGKPPMISAEGPAADIAETGRTTLNGGLSGGETDIVVTDAQAGEVGSVIKIGTSDNSGAGHQVTAKSGTTWTVTPAVSGAQSNGAEVTACVPSETVAGNPIPGISGSLVVDSVTLPITSFDVVLKNNWDVIGDEAFQSTITDGIPGFREVSGNIGVRARRDLVLYLLKRKDFVTRDLRITCGSTSGKKLQVDIDYAEFEFEAPDVPEGSVVTAKIPFKALGSSGEDEMSWTFI